MDPDMVIEVSDTPEKSMRVKAAASSSQQTVDHSEHIYRWHHNSFGINSSRISPHDTEELFKQAKLALSISEAPQPSTTLKVRNNGVSTKGKESTKGVNSHNNMLNMSYHTRQRDASGDPGKDPTDGVFELLGHRKSCELESSPPTTSVSRRCQNRASVELSQTQNGVLQDKTHVSSKSKDKGKETQCCNVLEPKSRNMTSHTLTTDITWRPTGRRFVRNGVISPCSTESMLQGEHGIAPSATRPCSSLVELNDLDNLEETDLSGAGHRNRQNSQNLHNDNAHYRRKSKQDKVGNVVLPGAKDGLNAISPARENVGDICNGKYDYSKKGKAVADYNFANEQHGKIELHSRRHHRRAEADVTVSGGTSGQTSSAENPNHHATGKPFSLSSSGVFGSHKKKEVPNGKLGSRSGFGIVLDNSQSIIFPESNSNTEQSISEGHSERRKKISIKGKRKCNSAISSTAQQSNSDFEDSEILYMGTSQHALNSRSNRSRNRQHSGIVLGPIIEVDELPSPVGTCSDSLLGSPEISHSTNVRARQVESDEILARRLQEQLYNESPDFRSSDEIDAILALSLQEESTWHTSSSSRQSHHDRRERFVTRLRSQLALRNARHRSSTRIARQLADIDLQRMDMDTRLDLFEELELAFGNSDAPAFSHILQLQRDFNENDYEALLALDDNNHQHLGASEIQINNLPQSVLQTDNVEEPCAICLENPSVGDIIRHLPCLHKFHKDCIDQWLRRKISCPICKSDIT